MKQEWTQQASVPLASCLKLHIHSCFSAATQHYLTYSGFSQHH